MSGHHRDIALRVATQTAAIVERYLPDVVRAVTTTDKSISFGVTVTFAKDRKTGLVQGTIRTRAPRIPVKDLEAVPFTVQVDAAGQLEFLFSGTPKAMLTHIEKETGS